MEVTSVNVLSALLETVIRDKASSVIAPCPVKIRNYFRNSRSRDILQDSLDGSSANSKSCTLHMTTSHRQTRTCICISAIEQTVRSQSTDILYQLLSFEWDFLMFQPLKW